MIKNAATYVKERVVLSALISRYAKLTPVSDTSYKTNCMFHKDNDPSMMVNDSPVSSPYFYCFSCGESGDFLKLLSTKANVAKSKVLWSSYEALQSGKTVEEWIRSFEEEHGIVTSQHQLIPRSSMVNRQSKSSKKSLQRDPLEEPESSVKDDFLQYNPDSIMDTLEEAKQFFTTRLVMDPNAYFVRSYLKERGISTETAMKFQLGYAPTMRLLKTKSVSSPVTNPAPINDKPIVPVSKSILKQTIGETFKQWQSMQGMTLTDWMLHGLVEASPEEDQKLKFMVHAGLTVNATKYLMKDSEDENNDSLQSKMKLHRRQTHYDRFRNRLMIPIRNQDGRILGFGGRELPLPRNLMTEEELRTLDQETKLKKPVAKYINSPSSVVFTKKKILFGLDTAAPYCEKENGVIMVEGYFDVIACYQAEVRNVVAAMGTSVTLEQLLLAANLSSSRTIILLLDNDAAGENATLRAKRIIKKHHEQVRKYLLRPDGDTLDEDEIQQNYSKYYITLRRASIDDALAYIKKHEIKTIHGKPYDPEVKKLKDCADICELFQATNARRIIKQIAKAAKVVDEDDDMDETKKDSDESSKKGDIPQLRINANAANVPVDKSLPKTFPVTPATSLTKKSWSKNHTNNDNVITENKNRTFPTSRDTSFSTGAKRQWRERNGAEKQKLNKSVNDVGSAEDSSYIFVGAANIKNKSDVELIEDSSYSFTQQVKVEEKSFLPTESSVSYHDIV